LDRFNVDAIIPARLEVSSLTERGFQGVLWGERADPAQHAPQPEIKALTRHNLTVEPTAKGWRAELLFDV
jgi:SHS2 domain-containing protein